MEDVAEADADSGAAEGTNKEGLAEVGNGAAAQADHDAIAEGDDGIIRPDASLLAALRQTDPGVVAAVGKTSSPHGSRSQRHLCLQRSRRRSLRETSLNSWRSRGSPRASRGSRGPRSRARRGVFGTTWPCQSDSEKLPWASETADAKSGDVKTTDAGDGAAEIHETWPWQSFRSTGDNDNDKMLSEAEGQLWSDMKEVAAEMPGHVKITVAEDGASAKKAQRLSQSVVSETDRTKSVTEVEGKPRSKTEESVGEEPSAEQFHALKRNALLVSESITASEAIMRHIREGLTQPKPNPNQPRLCGRCQPLPITKTANRWPDKGLHRDLKQNFDRVKNMCQDIIKPERQSPPQHWVSDVDSVQMPLLPAKSFFSQRPHPRFKAMAACDVFRLEIKIAQQKVKDPKIKEKLAKVNEVEADDKVKDIKELVDDLDMSVLRMVVQKPPTQRSFNDSLRLFQFLRNVLYFKDLNVNVLAMLALYIEACRFEVDEVLYKKGADFSGVYIVTRGSVRLEEKPAVREIIDGPRKSILATEMSAVEVAENEEMKADGKVFGVSDLLQDLVWPAPVLHRSTAVVNEPMEAFFLPADKLIPIMEENGMQERIKALQELLPATRGMSEKELQQPAKVKRCGVRMPIPIQRLFNVSTFPKNHTFYRYSENVPAEKARLYVILEGVVQLQGLTRYQDEVTAGALLGEEALQKDPYYHSAIVASDKARALWINVDEYVTQFLGGQFKASSCQQAKAALHNSERAGNYWKQVSVALKRMADIEDSGSCGDDEQDIEAIQAQHALFAKLKADKERREEVLAQIDPRRKKRKIIKVTHPFESTWVPKTVPNRVAPVDSRDVAKTRRQRVQALDKAQEVQEVGRLTKRSQHALAQKVSSDLEAYCTRVQQQTSTLRAISPCDLDSDMHGTRQASASRGEVVSQSRTTAAHRLSRFSCPIPATSVEAEGLPSNVGVAPNLHEASVVEIPEYDLRHVQAAHQAALRSLHSGGADIADPMPSAASSRKTVAFKPRPSIRPIAISPSTAGGFVRRPQLARRAHVAPAGTSGLQDVIESISEPRPPLPALPPGKFYSQSFRTRVIAEDVLNSARIGSARGEQRAGALATAAQSILTSPRPGEQRLV